MSGWCDDTSEGCNEGGAPINGNLEVKLNDSLPLIAGENRDTLKSPITDWGPYGMCSGNYSFQFDPQSNTLFNMQITGVGHEAGSALNFAIFLDSISLGIVSDSNWTLALSSWACSYSSHYSYRYMMITGTYGLDTASGQGQTTLVTPTASTASVEVSAGVPSSNIRITSLANGAVQIERSQNGSSEEVEIFDALGRVTARATIDGNVARVSNLPPGCYFARLGDQVAKFVVPSR